ncbi:MAG: SPFH domain-containing protein [Oscillospiraceae bacterium]
MDQSLTSRDHINTTDARHPGRGHRIHWGIKVNRVELKNIMPPRTFRSSMEKQMRAERDAPAGHSSRPRDQEVSAKSW